MARSPSRPRLLAARPPPLAFVVTTLVPAVERFTHGAAPRELDTPPTRRSG